MTQKDNSGLHIFNRFLKPKDDSTEVYYKRIDFVQKYLMLSAYAAPKLEKFSIIVEIPDKLRKNIQFCTDFRIYTLMYTINNNFPLLWEKLKPDFEEQSSQETLYMYSKDLDREQINSILKTLCLHMRGAYHEKNDWHNYVTYSPRFNLVRLKFSIAELFDTRELLSFFPYFDLNPRHLSVKFELKFNKEMNSRSKLKSAVSPWVT